jgi:hypothetical protein
MQTFRRSSCRLIPALYFMGLIGFDFRGWTWIAGSHAGYKRKLITAEPIAVDGLFGHTFEGNTLAESLFAGAQIAA